MAGAWPLAPLTLVRIREISCFDEVAKTGAAPRLLAHGLDNLRRRADAHVGANQDFFERVERIDINRPRPRLGRVRLPDDLFETLNELLFGALKATL